MSQSVLSILILAEDVDEDMASQICLPYFNGLTAKESGQICISVGDNDSIKQLVHDANLPVNVPLSIHLSDDSTSYQNNSGNDAFVILVVNAISSDGAVRSFEIYDAPTDDSIASATLRFENQGGILNLLNADNQKQTVGPIKISNGNFCVINNSTVNNGMNIIDGLAWVVERG